MNLHRDGGDVLRVDTPCATIPPSLLARSVVIPTCWGRHFHTSIDELYPCDRSTFITLRERWDSISFTPSNNVYFCLFPRTEVSWFIDLTMILPSIFRSPRGAPLHLRNSLTHHPRIHAAPDRERTSCTRTDFSSRPLRGNPSNLEEKDVLSENRSPRWTVRPTAPPGSRPRPYQGRQARRITLTTSTTRPRRRIAPAGPSSGEQSSRLARHSHSMVPGGLLVQSSTTRLTSGTELVIRLEMRARTS